MRSLGQKAEYLFCDVDAESVATLVEAAVGLGLRDKTRCVHGDGLASCLEAAHRHERDPGRVLVHVDPFDPLAETSPGLSAIALASDLMAVGFRLILWYCYDSPDRRTWPMRLLEPGRGSLWCGDLMLRSALEGRRVGSMSELTRIVGCGVVCANLSPKTLVALASLGRVLEVAYEPSLLPDGREGALHFEATTLE